METTKTARKPKPLDIRALIGAMLAIIGLILTAMGLFADPELHKTGGINANLMAGLVLLVAGALFLFRARMSPLKLRETHLD
ncbi:MAG: hypothetical protein L0G49_14990 [Luteococcus sp.]|uniref:hypothetical protein n=1 Tax=Luteococcus sp. TaxID=1969402 RepID=UPI002649930F|nr:hypothetical protein [Luteococcus sp.]MDN5565038.1 hypothetical protein [Luteococcus sp.]